MTFHSPLEDKQVKISIVGFVDDTTAITAAPPGSTMTELLRRTAKDAQLWNDLLFTSGGKLEISKCGYHTIYYDFNNSGLPKLIHQEPPPLQVTNSQGQTIPVKPKNNYTPQKYLGHYKCLAGNSNTQFQVVLKTAQKLSEDISKCPVS